MSRLLIVRLGSLGDLVHALPAVAALRRAYPDAEIDWLVDAAYKDFLALVPVISSVVSLRDRTMAAWLEARRTLRRRRYDVAMDFQGLLKSAALARLSGARRVIGLDRHALREGLAAPFYTEQVDVGEGQHVIHKNLRLVAALGVRTETVEFPFRVPDSEALGVLRAGGLGEFALLNPGAAWPNKRWPAQSFGALARRVRQHQSIAPVVVWGPGEAELADAVIASSGGAAVRAPSTSVADLLALAREARVFVAGDTGPLHLAAAVGTPIVSVFGPTNPARNGPWNGSDVAISRYGTCACHYERRCRRGADGWCLGKVSVDEVEDAVDARLRSIGLSQPRQVPLRD
jgi:lipopolysaccharide heptosyltransferase I